MTPLALVVAGLEAYSKSIDLWMKLIDKMPPESASKYADVIAAREVWAQENVWNPLGDAIESLIKSTDDFFEGVK